jgi:hypothetical protein
MLAGAAPSSPREEAGPAALHPGVRLRKRKGEGEERKKRETGGKREKKRRERGMMYDIWDP